MLISPTNLTSEAVQLEPVEDLKIKKEAVIVDKSSFKSAKPIVEPEIKNCEPFRALISQYDWDVNYAMAICTAESHGKYWKINENDFHNGCVGSSGLFQIACIHSPLEEMKDPKKNIAKAYEIYSQSGWRPWGAYTDGRYKKYLKAY